MDPVGWSVPGTTPPLTCVKEHGILLTWHAGQTNASDRDGADGHFGGLRRPRSPFAPGHEESARFGEKDCAVSGGRHSAAPGAPDA